MKCCLRAQNPTSLQYTSSYHVLWLSRHNCPDHKDVLPLRI